MGELKTGLYGDYYTGSLSENQRKANALYIYKYLSQSEQKWTLNAIAGLLGNIQAECSLDPGTLEALGSGFGLIQWTPGRIHKEWCDANGYSEEEYSSMDSQLAHIVDEAKNNTSWYCKNDNGTYYSESYLDFTKSKKSPYYLACAYAWNRERSGIILYGFHTNSHSAYCYPNAAFEVACRECYEEKYGTEAVDVQAEKNRDERVRKKRGTWATDWYNYLVNEIFEPRLDDSDTSVLTSLYWKSSRNNRGGLNYNTAIEDWPSAQAGWTEADQNNIRGTYTTLPNCTSWAWGRAYEIMQSEPPRFAGDAGNWWNHYDVLNEDNDLVNKGYIKSQSPSLGAIACWQDPNNTASMGHVAIVEEVFENGNISFSESGYQTWVWRPSYFNVQKNRNPKEAYSSKYVFVGFISLPTFGTALPTIDAFKFLDAQTEKANFEISISDNGSPISRVYYTLNTGETGDLDISSGITNFSIEKLVPNTNYEVSITVEAGFGSATSDKVTFITKQDYPDHVKNIYIRSKGLNLETETFELSVEAPARWGYWQRIGNAYGYKIFIIEDSKLIYNYDSRSIASIYNVIPLLMNVRHGKNFQVGISTWVTDNNNIKIYALPGEDFPTCSNAILLKETSEISDTWFLKSNNRFVKVQPYFVDGTLYKPLNVYKL